MDLWIRSQDKRAIYCVRQLRINGLDIMCLGGELLGTYKTKERALEVLDEIQKEIHNSKELLYDDGHIVNIPCENIIYEMPEE